MTEAGGRVGEDSVWADVAVADALGEMVPAAVLDAGGRIVYASTCWCTMTGWSREEVIGSHWLTVVHDDDRESAVLAGRRAVHEGRPVRYDARVVSRDGSRVTWVQSQVAPLAGPDGRVERWLLVAVDLTEHKLAEDALRASERRLQVIFDNSADVVTVLEPDGTWRSTTPNAARLLGVTVDDLSKGTFDALIHPDDRQVAKDAFEDLVERREGTFGRLYEVRLLLADGSVRWVETTGANLMAEPAVGGIVLHSRDVTGRHRAEEELLSVSSRLAALIGNVHLGVRIGDASGNTIAVNRSFVGILGLEVTPADLMGESAPDTLARVQSQMAEPEADTERIVVAVAARRPMTGARFTLVNGRTMEASFIPIEADGAYRGNMWVVRDLTDELAAAAEREYLLEVEKQQNARLVELDALKTGLVASVSHELRTPLTSIVSFSQLLREGLGVDSLEEQVEFLDIIGRNTERLLRLVDDLLLLDRMESNAVRTTLGPVDLAALVDQAASSIHPVAVENGIDLQVHIDPGPPLRGDPDRLGQLVDNLLANAVKFTPPGGRVSVAARPEGAGWCVEVADTGIGVPAEEQGRLFQRFFRASNARQQSTAGSGLGLAIVRRVAELHRGQVEVESVEGVGTIFTVTLRGALDQAVPVSPLTQAASWQAEPSVERGGQ